MDDVYGNHEQYGDLDSTRDQTRNIDETQEYGSASSGCTGPFLTDDHRERIKRCVAHYLIGPIPGAIQAQVTYSMMDVLDDDHLVELDVMIHDYDSDEEAN